MLRTFSQRTRITSNHLKTTPGIMNYAAAAGGAPRAPQQQAPQQQAPPQGHHNHPKQPTSRTNGHPQRSQHTRRHSSEERRTEHVTREEHKPRTTSEEELVYVLTLKLTDSLSKPMNSLREQYFPKRLNRTPAHLTLFHALPDSQFPAIDKGLSQVASSTKPFFVSSGRPFRMRLGVGINVGKGYNRMKQVHAGLREQWMSYLSEQDQGGWKPHWTVMNKVNEENEVVKALEEVGKEMTENVSEGEAVGLDLWRYDRGRWIFAKEYKFNG